MKKQKNNKQTEKVWERKYRKAVQPERVAMNVERRYKGTSFNILKDSLHGDGVINKTPFTEYWKEREDFLDEHLQKKFEAIQTFIEGGITESWRKNKIIYQVDSDLNNAIQEKITNIKMISANDMLHLPYKTGYVACHLRTLPKAEGFFYRYFRDPKEEYPYNMGTFHILPVKGGDFFIPQVTKELKVPNPVPVGSPVDFNMVDEALPYFMEALKIVLYISRLYNAEKEVKQSVFVPQTQTVKQSVFVPQTQTVKEHDSEIVYTKFQEYTYESLPYSTGKCGSPKRTHSRRGHWHSYWVGSRKDGTRHLTRKWVAETTIHPEGNQAVPTTVVEF